MLYHAVSCLIVSSRLVSYPILSHRIESYFIFIESSLLCLYVWFSQMKNEDTGAFDNEEGAFKKLKDKIAQEIWPQKEIERLPDKFRVFEAATANLRLECQCTSGFYDAEPAIPTKLKELLYSMWDYEAAHRPDSEDVYTDICEMAQMELSQGPSSI